MKPIHSIKRSQAGLGLLEALIAVALSAIVILGSVYSMGRMLVSQQQTNLQYIVVNQLRDKMQNASVEQTKNWCEKTEVPTIRLPKQTTDTTITVICEAMQVTVNSTNTTLNYTVTDKQPLKFEIEDAMLGGKVTVGESL
jgi:prepilin peptidase dependent protein B